MTLRRRMILSFSSLILAVSVVVSGFMVYGIYRYYFDNIESILVQQAQEAANLYQGQRLSENGGSGQPQNRSFSTILDDANYWYHKMVQMTPTEIVLFDFDGQRLAENGDVMAQTAVGVNLNSASSGEIQTWKGRLPNSKEQVLIVTAPLLRQEDFHGLLQLTTSLVPMNQLVWQTSRVILSAVAALTTVAILLCIGIANRMVMPIMSLTETANQMTAGVVGVGGVRGVRAKKHKPDEIGQLADAFNKMMASLEEKEQVKNDFIAAVSHELRTPLTSILGWSVTLKQPELEAEDAAMGLSIIENECQRLARMVDNLLDFSKITMDQHMLNFIELDFSELVAGLYQQMRPCAEIAQLSWSLDCQDVNVTVLADPFRLRQLLINLIDNAIKFTSEGGSVEMSLTTNQSHALLSIKDTGTGIPQENIAMIFEKFYKGKASREGSGLGLAICKALAEQHKGFIKVSSEVGVGTVMTLGLPLVKLDSLQIEQDTPSHRPDARLTP